MTSDWNKRERAHIDDLLSGKWGNRNGDGYWIRHTQKEIADLVAEYNNGEMILEEDGAARWKGGNYVPDDCAYKAFLGGVPLDLDATEQKRDAQTEEFLSEYRKRMENHVYSDEELSEMRNAFGEGEVVVNVITGKTIRL